MKKLNKKDFIEKSIKIHGEKYDYSLVDYVNSHTKVTIICHLHGKFEQNPSSHLNQQDCPICAKMFKSSNKLHTNNKFIENAIKVHGSFYNYDKVEYTGAKNKIIIICPFHGEFLQTPDCHLHKSGCSFCKSKFSSEDFFKEVSIIHQNKFDYSLSKFIKMSIKIDIICPIHGIFSQTPQHHLNHKQGCPKCSNQGTCKERWIKVAIKNKNAELYIIRCFNKNESFIKIGITSKNVYKRFYHKKVMPYEFEIIKVIKGSPEFIWNKEKELLKNNYKFSYKPLISFPGETECFNLQILSKFDL